MSIVEGAVEKLKAVHALARPERAEGAGDAAHQEEQDRGASADRAIAEGPKCTREVQIEQQVMKSLGVALSEKDQLILMDQYRLIKQELIRYHASPAPALPPAPRGAPSRRLVMVTSALPGDGKTFTSVNLALSMTSERDYEVLLVNCDIAKRHLTDALGLAEEPGLLDLLREKDRGAASVIYETNLPHLRVLPAGHWSSDVSELLASDRMKELLTYIAHRHKKWLIVLDSAPMLLSPDSRVLAELVGQIVLVVRAGETQQHHVTEAVELIVPTGRRLTLVLNQMRADRMLGYFYGYSHAYGARKQVATDVAAKGRLNGMTSSEGN